MKIISKGRVVREESYLKTYKFLCNIDGGFSFPCDKDGKIIQSEMNEDAESNLFKCEQRIYNVGEPEVERFCNSYWMPLIIECYCGKTLECPQFTNTCDCGRDYNSGGQLLASRDQWGEETGEHISEILSIQ